MAAQGSEGLAGGEPQGKAAIYSVELSVFEGPLDLLLHLVRRHELDILDIPISFVAEKYLEYLHLMRSLDLEVAGDYLVMAATLAWLKSRELLPAAPREGEAAGADDEEGEDPRAALIRRLVEYERFKNAAAELDAMPVSGRDVFARGADIDVPPSDPGLAPVTLFRLAEAYYRVLTRAKINKTHDVTIEAVTVAQRMQQLTLMLDERQEFDFEGLFLGRTWSSEPELRQMLVVTLMSVLELVKLGVARVQQVPDTDAIRVYRLVASEEARKLIETYDEEQSFGAPVETGPAPPTEAELDAQEERALLAEALAGLSGPEDDAGPGELGMLAEELDPDTLPDDPLAPDTMLTDEADLGPEAIAAEAANSDPTSGQDMSTGTGDPDEDDLSEETDDADPPETTGDDLSEMTDDLAETPGAADDRDVSDDEPSETTHDLSETPDAADEPEVTDDEPSETTDDLSETPGTADEPEVADDLSEATNDPSETPGTTDGPAGADDERSETIHDLSEATGAEDDRDVTDDESSGATDDPSEALDAAYEPAVTDDELAATPEATDESEVTDDELAATPDAPDTTEDDRAETPGASDEPETADDARSVTPDAPEEGVVDGDLSEAPGSITAPAPADVIVTNDDGEQIP